MTPKKLERRPAPARPKKSFLVLTEGKETEPGYLMRLQQLNRRNITVEFSKVHGSPVTLVNEAAARKKQAERDQKRQRGPAWDEVWCVFDVDEHPNISEALCTARDNGIGVALSNPCIELWFVLHFQDQNAYIHRHDVQDISESLLLCKKSLLPSALNQLVERFADAKRRAQALEATHVSNGSPVNENPSSNVWQLVDHLRP